MRPGKGRKPALGQGSQLLLADLAAQLGCLKVQGARLRDGLVEERRARRQEVEALRALWRSERQVFLEEADRQRERAAEERKSLRSELSALWAAGGRERRGVWEDAKELRGELAELRARCSEERGALEEQLAVARGALEALQAGEGSAEAAAAEGRRGGHSGSPVAAPLLEAIQEELAALRTEAESSRDELVQMRDAVEDFVQARVFEERRSRETALQRLQEQLREERSAVPVLPEAMEAEVRALQEALASLKEQMCEETSVAATDEKSQGPESEVRALQAALAVFKEQLREERSAVPVGLEEEVRGLQEAVASLKDQAREAAPMPEPTGLEGEVRSLQEEFAGLKQRNAQDTEALWKSLDRLTFQEAIQKALQEETSTLRKDLARQDQVQKEELARVQSTLPFSAAVDLSGLSVASYPIGGRWQSRSFSLGGVAGFSLAFYPRGEERWRSDGPCSLYLVNEEEKGCSLAAELTLDEQSRRCGAEAWRGKAGCADFPPQPAFGFARVELLSFSRAPKLESAGRMPTANGAQG